MRGDSSRKTAANRWRSVSEKVTTNKCPAYGGFRRAVVRDEQQRWMTRSGELLPLPLGDDLDVAVVHLDGRLVIDGVGRASDVAGPPLRLRHGVGREDVEVREDREVDDPQGPVVRCGWPLDEGLTDPRRHHH